MTDRRELVQEDRERIREYEAPLMFLKELLYDALQESVKSLQAEG